MLLCPLLLALVPTDDPVTLAVDLDAGVPGARLWTRCGPPIPGLPFCLGVDGGQSGQAAWIGLGTVEAPLLIPGVTGVVFLGGGIVGQPIVLDGGGSSPDVYAIAPLDPALLGAQLVAQGLTVSPIFAIEMTNGLRLRVGPAVAEPFAGVPAYFAGDDVRDEHVVGDFNGDGRADVVSSIYRTNLDESFAVHHGRPDGSLELVQEPSSTQCNTGSALTAADFDADGRIDIALGCQWMKEIKLYRGLANGTFAFADSFTIGDGLGLEPTDIVAGDLDFDIFPELVAAMEDSDELVVRFGPQWSGSLEVRIPTIPAPTDVEIADLDGDGWADLVVGTDYANFGAVGTVGIHRRTGPTAFGPLELVPVHPVAAASVYSVEVGDLTGDGVPDLCAGFLYQTGVAVVPGIGDGTFAAPILLDLPETCQSVTLGDLDLDGALDIVGVGAVTSEPHLWLQTGGGNFVPGARIHPLGPGASQPSIHDMDGDGIPDLVFGSGPGNFVSVLHATAPGQLPFPSTASAGAGPTQQLTADMDADGRPDLVTVTRATVSAWYGMNVRLAQADGSYSVAEAGTMASTIPVIGVGDLNHDDFPDVVYYSNKAPTFTDRFTILLGNGDGTTTHVGNLSASGVYPRFVEMVDANADGNPDVVWGTASSGGPLTVALGVGDGKFSNKLSVTKDLSNSWRVDVHDVDGDGDEDLVLIDFDDAQVFLNEPPGAPSMFSKQPSLKATGSIFPCGGSGYDLEDVAAGDLNGDGLADLALALDSNCSGNHVGLAVALATGPGVFAPVELYDAVDHNGYRVEVADMDLDGRLDVVLQTSTVVEIFPGLGDGTLGPSRAYLRGGGGSSDLVVDDLDLDGAPDLGLMGGANDWVHRLLNRNGEQP